jgi:hypothetical protein
MQLDDFFCATPSQLTESMLSSAAQIPTVPKIPGTTTPAVQLKTPTASPQVQAALMQTETDAVIQSKVSQHAQNLVIKNIARQAQSMLKHASSADDLKRVKTYIDREFAKNGLLSESAFARRDQLMHQVHVCRLRDK